MRTGDRALWGVFAASVAALLFTLLLARLTSSPVPPAAGPVYPRVPAPPGGTGELLHWLGVGSLTWYACILSAPLFVLLARRLPLERGRLGRSLAAHVVVIGFLVLATAAVQHAVTYAGAPSRPELRVYLLSALLTGGLPFIAIAAGAQAFEARTRARDRELEAARVRGQLAEARLEALTGRLQPHFLFNTLQGISTLIHHEPATADRMLARLADLLREVLKRRDQREVPIAEELEVLAHYLDIARLRFGPRVTVDIDVDDDARDAVVPFFILQPLVENALEHGVGEGPARLRITARRAAERLLLTVSDDGPGLAGEPSFGVGLDTTRARLRETYGRDAELRLDSPASGGTEVTIDLPFKRAIRTAGIR